MVWHFIGVYVINRKLHGRLEIQNFSSRVKKYFTRLLCSLVEYFSTLEEKFRISARPCNVLCFFLAVLLHAMGRVLISDKAVKLYSTYYYCLWS